jgi:hypothetical protein
LNFIQASITLLYSDATDDIITSQLAITFTTAATKVFLQDISQITVSNTLGGTGVYEYAVVASGDPAPTTYNNQPSTFCRY